MHGLRVARALSSFSISAALVLRNARIAIAAVMARGPEDCDWRRWRWHLEMGLSGLAGN
jgi:hypothetical protein